MVSSFAYRRIGQFGLIALALGVSGCGLTVAPPGFVREHRQAMCRSWFDWNSHRRFSLTFETYDRLPPESSRVKLFRWSHGGSVDKPREVAFDLSPTFHSPELASDSSGGNADASQIETGNSTRHGEEKGQVEILPPPPAPPSDWEGSDDGSSTSKEVPDGLGVNAALSAGEHAEARPSVTISFSENLDEPGNVAGSHSPDCSLPPIGFLPE